MTPALRVVVAVLAAVLVVGGVAAVLLFGRGGASSGLSVAAPGGQPSGDADGDGSQGLPAVGRDGQGGGESGETGQPASAPLGPVSNGDPVPVEQLQLPEGLRPVLGAKDPSPDGDPDLWEPIDVATPDDPRAVAVTGTTRALPVPDFAPDALRFNGEPIKLSQLPSGFEPTPPPAALHGKPGALVPSSFGPLTAPNGVSYDFSLITTPQGRWSVTILEDDTRWVLDVPGFLPVEGAGQALCRRIPQGSYGAYFVTGEVVREVPSGIHPTDGCRWYDPQRNMQLTAVRSRDLTLFRPDQPGAFVPRFMPEAYVVRRADGTLESAMVVDGVVVKLTYADPNGYSGELGSDPDSLANTLIFLGAIAFER
jgi:hypothetical protein